MLLGRLLSSLSVILLVAASSVQAQTNAASWRWSNPLPHGGNVFDMTSGLGVKVQVAERGQLYTSEDLLLWLPKVTGTTNALRAVTFFGDRLVVTGEKGTVLYGDSLEDLQLVDLGTTNWLEAVTASANLIMAVGDNGSVYTSSDGAAWDPPVSLPNNNKTWLRAAAYGGNTFVVAGENGYIASANSAGKNFTDRASTVSTHLNRAAYINGKFWVVGNAGTILSSPAGTTWTKITSVSVTNNLYAVTGTNSTIVVAGEQIVLRSENGGTNWVTDTDAGAALPAPKWTYYSAVNTDGLFLLSGRSGMLVEGFKTNTTAQVWVERADSYRDWLWAVHRLPDFYVAVGDHGTILTSSKGVNWDLELTPDAATNNIFLGAGGTGNGAVIVGNQGTILFSPTNDVTVLYTNLDTTITTNIVSTLGSLWYPVDPKPVSIDLQGVCVFNGLYVVSGGSGTILTSNDGTNWTQRSTSTSAFLSGLATNATTVVAVGDQGAILSSSDGATWVPRVSNTTKWMFRVKNCNGTFVAVGEGGTILTSVDGITWTPRNSRTTSWLNDVACVNGEYVAVGNQGAVVRSPDLVNWTFDAIPTQKSLFGVASFGGQLVTVGVEGAILRQPVTRDLTPVRFIDYGKATNQNLVLLSGVADQKFALETSTNLVDWEEGVSFEIVDRSGTLLIKQADDTTETNRQFFRARMIP